MSDAVESTIVDLHGSADQLFAGVSVVCVWVSLVGRQPTRYTWQSAVTIRGVVSMKTPIASLLLIFTVCLTIFLGVDLALGQDLFIYPSKGQSPEQQNQDRYECHTWAVQQTRYDPTRAQTAAAPPPPQQAPQGGVLRSAGRGAAVGAVGWCNCWRRWQGGCHGGCYGWPVRWYAAT